MDKQQPSKHREETRFIDTDSQKGDIHAGPVSPPSDSATNSTDKLDLQEAQIYKSKIWRYGSSTEPTKRGRRRYITKACDDSFWRVHMLCKKLRTENWPHEIPIRRDSLGFCIIPKQKLGLLYRAFPRFLDDYLPHYVYSPYLNEAYKLAKAFGFLKAQGGRGEQASLWDLRSPEALAECNRYFRELAAIFHSPKFKQTLYECKRASQRKEYRLHSLIRSMFDWHYKVMGVRVDLEYGREDHSMPVDLFATEQLPDGFRLNRVHDDFKRFLNGLRQLKWTKHLKVYAWRLEFGRQRGYHIHFFALFNGSEVCNDVHYADLLIEYWKQVAGPYAQGWNCNAEAFGYRRVGIGEIKRDDTVAIGNLMFAASYLAKETELLDANVDDHMRTFDASRPLPPRKRKREADTAEDENMITPLEFIPKAFDYRERYTAKFNRSKAVSARNPQRTSARQYLRTHDLPIRRKTSPIAADAKDPRESL